MTTDHSSDKTFYNVSYVLLFFDCYITSKVIDVLSSIAVQLLCMQTDICYGVIMRFDDRAAFSCDIIDNKHAIVSPKKVSDKYSLCQDFMGTKLVKVRKRIFSDYQ